MHTVRSETRLPAGEIHFSCRPDNDLYSTLRRMGRKCPRHPDPNRAVEAAGDGDAILLLADGYPERRTPIDPEVPAVAAEKGLRLYVEFPARLPGLETGEAEPAGLDRLVVASGAFAPDLPKGRILGLHGCRYVPVAAAKPHLVLARVAGFDRAVFGIPSDARAALFELPASDGAPEMLVATTKLSQFLRGRYSPTGAWTTIWEWIFSKLSRGCGSWAPQWDPAVRPRFRPEEELPADAEERALADGVDWFRKSRLLVHPAWAHKWDEAGRQPDRVWDAPGPEKPVGDGSEGLLEGFSSRIDENGRQKVRWYLRGDCNAEAAMAHAFQAHLAGDSRAAAVAVNLLDFVFSKSNLTGGPRADPESPSYGLIGWDTRPEGVGVYYGDDNAKLLLAARAAAVLLGERRWDEKIVRGILANFRTSGRLGFRGHNLNEESLSRAGWRSHFQGAPTHFAPHFESWLWACYLALYRNTGYEPLLARTRAGLRLMMEAYADRWRWTNGLQQERARMLLPLAWLVRLEDTAEHRGWLRRIATDLLASQTGCGAIREEVGSRGLGRYAPPASNEDYGTTEAPLIQENGDPLADLLYTVNFASLGLREAAAAGESDCARAEAKLAEFLCRIQARSKALPELDGAWFRAFDYERWEYWGSDADSGWGAWSIETGWTQAWICAVIGLRRAGTSLWDLLEKHPPEPDLCESVFREMIPDDALPFGEPPAGAGYPAPQSSREA